jgi:hypothetical protein
MKKMMSITLCLLFIFSLGFCPAGEKTFPDLGGILDFSKPKKIKGELFILTHPKSGSHLLMYSIMKITKRPLRGRLPLWHFENDPPCFPPENMLNYPIDFSKPTMYWGHEIGLLKNLNHSGNKLLLTHKDYIEVICSHIVLKNKRTLFYEQIIQNLEALLLDEFQVKNSHADEYFARLALFDQWSADSRCLVSFEDLVYHPEKFIPEVM